MGPSSREATTPTMRPTTVRVRDSSYVGSTDPDGYYLGDESTESPGLPFDLQDVIEIVQRRWRWLTIGALLGLFIGVSTWWVLPRKFVASTSILVEPQEVPESYVRSTITLECRPTRSHPPAARDERPEPRAADRTCWKDPARSVHAALSRGFDGADRLQRRGDGRDTEDDAR